MAQTPIDPLTHHGEGPLYTPAGTVSRSACNQGWRTLAAYQLFITVQGDVHARGWAGRRWR